VGDARRVERLEVRGGGRRPAVRNPWQGVEEKTRTPSERPE
jgi:hypothetical protein